MPKTSARLLSLLSLLQARRGWPGALPAERLEVSLRTVRRDVDRLRELGYPIAAAKGPDGGYRLDAGTDLPTLPFDDEQAATLQIAATSGAGVEEAATRALTTVRQVMPARLRRRIDTLRVTAVERPAARPQVDSGFLMALSAAVHARVRCCASTTPPRSRRARTTPTARRAGCSPTTSSPGAGAGTSSPGTWTATTGAPSAPTGSPRALRPALASLARTARRRGGRLRGREIPGLQRLQRLALPRRGDPLPAAAVSPYVRDGVVEELGPDRCRLILGSWSWPGLAAAIGRFDADVEVVGPPELKDAFAHLAHRYAAAAELPHP